MLAVVSLVGGATEADSVDAGAVIGAGGVDALVLLDVTLGALPAGVTLTEAFLVISVTAAEDRAGVCNTAQTAL